MRRLKRPILLAALAMLGGCVPQSDCPCEHDDGDMPAPITQAELSGIPRQGEYRELTKWTKYAYRIATPYPYVRSLPTSDKIPEVIALLGQSKKNADIPESQLTCLTRISFDSIISNRRAKDRSKDWQRWWDAVGRDYFQRVEMEGKRDPQAWMLLVGDEPIPCPDYKILIPEQWHFEVSFHSGDYGGVQQETIVMERTREGATLKRHYSTRSTDPFHYEVWHGFTPQEADRFLYALAYAIDQPWFVKRFICVAPDKTATKSPIQKGVNPGRNWGNYYASAQWSGVLLPDGRVWWNDDPWTWKSTSLTVSTDFDDTRLDAGCRLVYPFVCHHYPEKQSVAGGPGWEADPNPPALKDRPKSAWGK